jgi:cytochrome c
MFRAQVLGAVLLAVSAAAAAQEAPAGDAAAGQRAFAQCSTCHSFDPTGRKQGPHLLGVVGREAGAVEGFRYSPALGVSEIVWNRETLARYLANPRQAVPGTTMLVGALRAQQIPDLIAYLESQTGD